MKALILGGAKCVWDDLERAGEFGPYDATFAINDVLAHYKGPVDYAASLHPEHFEKWISERNAKGYPRPHKFVSHSTRAHNGSGEPFPIDLIIDYLWRGASSSGSTGLYAVKAALTLGFTHIVLCGVPMDATQAHFHDRTAWTPANDFWPAWTEALPHYAERTRSMSGRTKDLLGEPTQDWLDTALTANKVGTSRRLANGHEGETRLD